MCFSLFVCFLDYFYVFDWVHLQWFGAVVVVVVFLQLFLAVDAGSWLVSTSVWLSIINVVLAICTFLSCCFCLFFCWEPPLLHCLSGCVSCNLMRFQPKTLNPRSLLIKVKTKSIQAAQSLENLKFVLTVSMGVLLANKVGPIHDPQN